MDGPATDLLAQRSYAYARAECWSRSTPWGAGLLNDRRHGGGSNLRVLAWPATRVQRDGRESDPYPRLLYTGLARKGIDIANFHWTKLLFGRWHIWHMHWPDWIVAGSRPSWILLLRIALFGLLIGLSRLKGTRLIWTAHNLAPHESDHPSLERWFFGLLTGNLAAVICLSRSAKALFRQRYPQTRHFPVYIVPHGHYRGCYPDAISRQEARQKLGLGGAELVFLFIGQLRRYKNVIRLIECFRDGARPHWRLIIAGRRACSRLQRDRPCPRVHPERPVADLPARQRCGSAALY
jgi:beta-1,4-mannosyltransferase